MMGAALFRRSSLLLEALVWPGAVARGARALAWRGGPPPIKLIMNRRLRAGPGWIAVSLLLRDEAFSAVVIGASLLRAPCLQCFVA